LGTLQWYQSEFPSPACAKYKMTRRRGRGGQPVTGIPEGEEPEVSMGETHETKNATYEEAEILAEKVAQTMKRCTTKQSRNYATTLRKCRTIYLWDRQN
jgi:hypothetical protein